MNMQTHSTNRLGEMLERDRGTVVKALRNTPPDRVVKGKPQWKIATASRAVEAHLRASDGGGNGGGADPTLTQLYARFDQADATMRALPELEQRRAAARRMAVPIAEIDRAVRAHGRSVGADVELTDMRADRMYMLALRGLEGPCEWTQAETWELMEGCG
jgi:hypothetical protein